jgi:hypothetical protein
MRYELLGPSLIAALVLGACSASNAERRENELQDPNPAPASLNVCRYPA